MRYFEEAMTTSTDTDGIMPEYHTGTDYTHFLPWLAGQYDVANYLEIGVNMGHLLSRMKVDHAIGVDPAFIINANVAQGKRTLHLIQKTSDRFFREEQDLLGRIPPQLAFLDGMHLYEYLLRDFINTERACLKNSLIVMHDCLPLSVEMCHRNQDASRDLTRDTPYYGWWTGDVWKIVPILKTYRPDLKVVCIDAAPTGLVCVSNVDPASRVLEKSYLDIVAEFSEQSADAGGLQRFYSDIRLVSASRMMSDASHGIYFRI